MIPFTRTNEPRLGAMGFWAVSAADTIVFVIFEMESLAYLGSTGWGNSLFCARSDAFGTSSSAGTFLPNWMYMANTAAQAIIRNETTRSARRKMASRFRV